MDFYQVFLFYHPDIKTWKPSAEASLTVATLVLAFTLSPIPFLDIADSDLTQIEMERGIPEMRGSTNIPQHKPFLLHVEFFQELGTSRC